MEAIRSEPRDCPCPLQTLLLLQIHIDKQPHAGRESLTPCGHGRDSRKHPAGSSASSSLGALLLFPDAP